MIFRCLKVLVGIVIEIKCKILQQVTRHTITDIITTFVYSKYQKIKPLDYTYLLKIEHATIFKHVK